jgi:hypothetical protein
VQDVDRAEAFVHAAEGKDRSGHALAPFFGL